MNLQEPPLQPQDMGLVFVTNPAGALWKVEKYPVSSILVCIMASYRPHCRRRSQGEALPRWHHRGSEIDTTTNAPEDALAGTGAAHCGRPRAAAARLQLALVLVTCALPAATRDEARNEQRVAVRHRGARPHSQGRLLTTRAAWQYRQVDHCLEWPGGWYMGCQKHQGIFRGGRTSDTRRLAVHSVLPHRRQPEALGACDKSRYRRQCVFRP